MTAAKGQIPLTVALINSETLESELLSSVHFSADLNSRSALNIYALAQLMDICSRRAFVAALKQHRSFECVAAHNGHHLSISLYTVTSYGDGWSHVLMLRDTQSGIRPA